MTETPESPDGSDDPGTDPVEPVGPWQPETIAIRAGRADERRPRSRRSCGRRPRSSRRRSTRVGAWRRRSAPSRFYTRYGNPTVQRVRRRHRRNSKAPRQARAFASGMGAVSAVVSACARQAITSSPSGSSTRARSCCCSAACPRFGIDVTFVDGTEPGAFAAAVRPGKTVLVFAETPANPQLDARRSRRGRRDRRVRSRSSTRRSRRRSANVRSTTASTW